MRANRLVLLVLAAAHLAAAPARAQQPADKQPLTVAIYAPNAPFDGADARYGYVQRLATHIGNLAGTPTKGVAFKNAGDFEAAVKRGGVDFAIVDAVYLAARGGFKVIATAKTGGRTSQPWALFVGGGVANVVGLRGKRLVYATASSRDLAFVEHALLDSELSVSKFFSARQGAPDIASAVASVSLGRADAVLAPIDKGKGLKKVFEAAAVPNPGFVQAKTTIPDAVVASVTRAVLGFGAGGALETSGEPMAFSAAKSRDTPMEKPVEGTSWPRKRATRPS